MGNLAQHRLSDLLTGTEENCASQAFSQLCHPCNRIISPCDSKRGAYSPYRASAPQSMRLTSTGPRALAAGWVTPLCVLGLGVHGDTKPQLCSHRPGAIRCRIRAGRSPGCAAMNWGGRTDTRGVGSPRDAQLLGGWGGGWVPHRHPLQHAPLQPDAASPLRPAQRSAPPSAARWKFPSSTSSGASRDQQTSPGPPGRSWGAAISMHPTAARLPGSGEG